MRYRSIYTTVEQNRPPTLEEMTAMGQLIEESMKSGALLATEGCLPSAKGVRVRLSQGELVVTDGPFTESKEVIGGFAILEASSKEEAIAQAKKFLRVAGDGECEIRELYTAAAAPCGQSEQHTRMREQFATA